MIIILLAIYRLIFKYYYLRETKANYNWYFRCMHVARKE